jgi:NAD(P)H-dependent FMN reductase
MLKIGIITGSTRPNRKSLDVAKWVLEIASRRNDAEVELVDIKDFELPMVDEPMPLAGRAPRRLIDVAKAYLA